MPSSWVHLARFFGGIGAYNTLYVKKYDVL